MPDGPPGHEGPCVNVPYEQTTSCHLLSAVSCSGPAPNPPNPATPVAVRPQHQSKPSGYIAVDRQVLCAANCSTLASLSTGAPGLPPARIPCTLAGTAATELLLPESGQLLAVFAQELAVRHVVRAATKHLYSLPQ